MSTTKNIPLSEDAVTLLLILLEVNRGSLEATFRHALEAKATSWRGRAAPTPGDMRMAQELELTIKLIGVFEEAAGTWE